MELLAKLNPQVDARYMKHGRGFSCEQFLIVYLESCISITFNEEGRSINK